MFGMSGTELMIILLLALLLLGPQKLPEVANMLGKGMREFQKATSDLRATVESEFAKMDKEIRQADTKGQTAGEAAQPAPAVAPVPGAVPAEPALLLPVKAVEADAARPNAPSPKGPEQS